MPAGASAGASENKLAKAAAGARRESQTSADSKEEVAKKDGQGRTRKDGTANKMSFDVDELEEGMYIQVEDEDDIEEIVEYEEEKETEAVGSRVEGTGGAGDASLAKIEGESGPVVDETVGYKIRPDLTQKFRPGTVQKIIEEAIKDKVEGKEYSPEESEEWTRQILEDIHEKVKSQNYKRYKIASLITLGERRGEGASCATRCLWDAEADCMATYTFLNDTIFCNGTVYGIYFY